MPAAYLQTNDLQVLACIDTVTQFLQYKAFVT